MLFLWRGRLISSCEVETCVVQMRFEVAMAVEPQDGVGYGGIT